MKTHSIVPTPGTAQQPRVSCCSLHYISPCPPELLSKFTRPNIFLLITKSVNQTSSYEIQAAHCNGAYRPLCARPSSKSYVAPLAYPYTLSCRLHVSLYCLLYCHRVGRVFGKYSTTYVSSESNFVYSLLPTILLVGFCFLWAIAHHNFMHMQAYLQISTDDASVAEDSLLLGYSYMFPPFMAFKHK